jgi:hypothetical protein
LAGFKANSRVASFQGSVSYHLSSNFFNKTQGLIPKRDLKRQHTNPYLDMWTHVCHEIEWAGPIPTTVREKKAHHVMVIFYHHFGCIVPTYAALSVIAKLAQPAKPSKEPVKPILDLGSGCGYWTFMLRNLPLDPQMKALDVRAIDNAASEYRTMWIDDTHNENALTYLSWNRNGKGCVLLLVYPPAMGNFTSSVLKAFEGDSIVVAGTQNANGFTGFRHVLIDEWIHEHLPAFELTLRMPLPSISSKDEALYVFQRTKT